MQRQQSTPPPPPGLPERQGGGGGDQGQQPQGTPGASGSSSAGTGSSRQKQPYWRNKDRSSGPGGSQGRHPQQHPQQQQHPAFFAGAGTPPPPPPPHSQQQQAQYMPFQQEQYMPFQQQQQPHQQQQQAYPSQHPMAYYPAGTPPPPPPPPPHGGGGRRVGGAGFAATPPPPPPPGISRGGSSSAGHGRRASQGPAGRGAAAAVTPISDARPSGGRGAAAAGAAAGIGGSFGYGTPLGYSGGTPLRGRGGGSALGGSGGGGDAAGSSSSALKGGRRGAYYREHLPSHLLQQGLKSGAIFRAVFRTNPSDRTQSYCSLPGLPTDVFVRGLKLQNRAMEGDEVAIRILPPTDWHQLSSRKAAAARASPAAAAAAAALAAPAAAPNPQQQEQQQAAKRAPGKGNVLPLPGRLRASIAAATEAATAEAAAAAGGVPATPLTAAVGAGPAAMTPPAWAGLQPADRQQLRPMGDLLASPALLPSASGGDLGIAAGPTALHGGTRVRAAGGTAREESEGDSEAGSVSSEGCLSDEEKDAMMGAVEEDLLGLHLDTDIAAVVNAAATGEQQQQQQQASSSEGTPEADVPAVAAPDGQQEQQQDQQQQQQQEGSADEEPESMVDFLLTSQLNQPAAAAPAAAVRSARLGQAPAAGSCDPLLRCWHRVGQPEAALRHIADQLQQQKGWRVTGEVVAVLEPSRRRESVVGVLKQEGDKDTGTFFLIPCDPRLPRMTVRSATMPANLKQVLKQEAQTADLAARTLVSGRVAAWDAAFPFPLAQVRASIGQAGDLVTETAALLSMEQVQDDDTFTPEVLACLPPTPWVISEEELGCRRDFRQHRIFSIDPPTARDLDDALSVEELPGGAGCRVGVHIADVSHFVQAGSALDKEAQQRSTSVYLVDRVIPMLPRLLCEELCSLNPGVDRLAFSVVWDMTPEGDITSTWAGRSVIRTCGKLAYPAVQSMIEGQFLALEGQQPPCDLWGDHSWPDVVKDSLTLHRIASSLRKRRFDGGALRLDNTRLYFKLDEEGNPRDYGVYEQREANQLVEEFMLLANMTTASMVAEHFPDRALLRCHPPPNQNKMAELADTAMELGFTLDTSGAGPLQRSLAVLRAALADPAALEVITLLATKPMQNARYFCTGETPDESFWRHFALAVAHYTHFTSPIRRYPDIVVHRLMAALLDGEGSAEQRAQRHGVYATREVGLIASHANDRKMAAKSVQDGSLRLYLCVMLHRQPLVCDAVVMQLGGSRFFDCYIPALGCDVRIHVNSLLRGGDGAIVASWQAEEKILGLQHTAVAPGQRGERDEPDYTDIPNLPALRNPAGVQPAELPLTLRMLTHVPIIVSSRRSATSGSPTHVCAKLWLKQAAAAAPSGAGQQQQGEQQRQQQGLREALAQGMQEAFD